MSKTDLFTVRCKAPGCGFEGSPDMVQDHCDGHLMLVCPRCRSKNVKTVAVNAPNGERLGRVRLFSKLRRPQYAALK